MKKAITLLLSLILLIAFSALLTACEGGTGPQGANDADGVSIIKTEIIDGYLWITYSKNTKDKEEAFYGECLFFYIFAV